MTRLHGIALLAVIAGIALTNYAWDWLWLTAAGCLLWMVADLTTTQIPYGPRHVYGPTERSQP